MDLAEYRAKHTKQDKPATKSKQQTATVSHPENHIASIDEQRVGFRTDWHERQIPPGAVLIDSRASRFVYEYQEGKNKYRVTTKIELIK